VKRTFHLIEQIRNAVQIDAGTATSERSGADDKRLSGVQLCRLGEATTEHVIHDLAQRPAGPPYFRFQLCRDVVIERQRGSHIMMLVMKHHDVKFQV
jgi:hypothetical protein